MTYWITTHWPRRVDQLVGESHEGVWVPDGKRHVIERVAADDLVFIYESQSGRTEIRTYLDGTTKEIACRRGQQGIVALARVIASAYQPEGSQPEEYTDGTTLWWRYYAPTKSVDSSGFIPCAEAAALMGFSDQYTFRGFGESNSGLKQISDETFERIHAAFTLSAEANEQRELRKASRARFGSGGEGEEHRELKRRIVANPATVLGDQGLRFWAEEWTLPTGDRIDLVLKDSYNRFVAVEVEVDCGEAELAGPLQCMKYRAMLSYFFRRPVEALRKKAELEGRPRCECGKRT